MSGHHLVIEPSPPPHPAIEWAPPSPNFEICALHTNSRIYVVSWELTTTCREVFFYSISLLVHYMPLYMEVNMHVHLLLSLHVHVRVGFITCNTVPSRDGIVTGTEVCPLKQLTALEPSEALQFTLFRIRVHCLSNLHVVFSQVRVFLCVCSVLFQTCQTGTLYGDCRKRGHSSWKK